MRKGDATEVIPYELVAAIEQAIIAFRIRHPDTPLYLKTCAHEYQITFEDPKSGFLSSIFIPYDISRKRDSGLKFEAELISEFEEAFDEMTYILEGKTCTETVN